MNNDTIKFVEEWDLEECRSIAKNIFENLDKNIVGYGALEDGIQTLVCKMESLLKFFKRLLFFFYFYSHGIIQIINLNLVEDIYHGIYH